MAPVKEPPAHLSRSREDYLKTLHALEADGVPVAVGELARALAVSPPSVTNMVARLARERLVISEPRAGARLTALGRRRALQTVRRHRLLETFLVRTLGLDWSEAHEDAEVMEHGISDRVLEAIERTLGFPREDPHGHPIPDRRGRLPRRDLLPLALLATGRRAIVRELRDRDAGRLARWRRDGLVPGARVRMRSASAEDGVFALDVAGRRLVTGAPALEGVLVEPVGQERES